MKNIKPNTKYYITFKEKTELTEVTNPAHGLYLKPDTASTVSDVTDAAQVTHAALTRNNGNIGIHQEACADTDWEERTIEWTSGSGIDTDKFPGDDVLAAKLEFTFMSALGTVQIKDLEMFEEPKESEFAPLSLAGEGIKQYSVIIDKIFRNITIPVYPGTNISELEPKLELPEGISAEITEGTWESGTLTLSKDGESEEWSVNAEARANPVIDGYYADPNIVIFGDTYYIYPTTDGGTDWNTLADITPDSNYKEATFVIKRDGKYYFMWSDGDTGSWNYNVRYGVSESPLGPIEGNTRILSRNNTNSPLIRGNAHHSVINIPGTDER